MASSSPTNTVESKTAADYLDPTRAPEPSAETGPGTHFSNTFSASQAKDAPMRAPKTTLEDTSSSMSTAQLQKVAEEAKSTDPNLLQSVLSGRGGERGGGTVGK